MKVSWLKVNPAAFEDSDDANGDGFFTYPAGENLSYRVGCKQLLLDPKTESFTNSPEANQLARLEYRDPYRFPETV